ncbi:unnamed protein product [Dovyalis caffra]|uniref:Uncharacterized protein n=1 Tax=Dovyalis caffra TaxID=77055 RepID=A0AAV1RXQ6_9ROSI|nr:unnamed protein product [Dovyalis caffra]
MRKIIVVVDDWASSMLQNESPQEPPIKHLYNLDFWSVVPSFNKFERGQLKTCGSFNDEDNVTFTEVWRYIMVEDES